MDFPILERADGLQFVNQSFYSLVESRLCWKSDCMDNRVGRLVNIPVAVMDRHIKGPFVWLESKPN